MKKKELVEEMMKKTGFNRSKTIVLLDSMIEAISETLAKGERVTILNFGTFKINKRNQRMVFHPKTGNSITTRVCNIVTFKPGKLLNEAVESSQKK